MSIVRVSKNAENPYAQVSRAMLRDQRASWGARGLLSHLLSHTDGWQISVAQLVGESPAGRDACYALVDELGRLGYLERQEERERGRIIRYAYVVHEEWSEERMRAWKPGSRSRVKATASGETASGSALYGSTASGQTVYGSAASGEPHTKKEHLEEEHREEEPTPPNPPAGGAAEAPQDQSPALEPDARPEAPQAPRGTEAEGGDPPGSSDNAPGPCGHGNANASEKVPPARRERREASEAETQALVETYNAHRGVLPEVQALNDGRRKAATKLLRDCGWDLDRARATLTDATREIAADDWWTSRKLGFDVLMPSKVQGKAEAWRARHTSPPPAAHRRRNYA